MTVTTVCPRVVGSTSDGREVVLCGTPLPCAKHRHRPCVTADELAHALCDVARRHDRRHNQYPAGGQPCAACLDLARAVAAELGSESAA